MLNSVVSSKRKVSYPIGEGKVMHLRQGQKVHNGKLFVNKITEEVFPDGNSRLHVYVKNEERNEIKEWKTILNGMAVIEMDLGILFDE